MFKEDASEHTVVGEMENQAHGLLVVCPINLHISDVLRKDTRPTEQGQSMR